MAIKYALHKCLQFGLFGLVAWLSVSLLTTKAQAQPSNIVPDNTLGAESSQVISNFGGLPVEVITGGAVRQINLFHSLQEFNVSAGRGAYFFTPNSDIQNIFTRVTGNNPSEILGILGTFGRANPNLYLINPNGIIFGQNASLNLQGSFVATTANGVQFGNQGNFSATNPQPVPLLTINPSALFFNRINQSQIINRSRQLAIPGSLYLIGGDITFDGGIGGSVGNRLELGAVAGTGTVELIGSGNQMQLGFPEGISKADIVLQNNALALTSGGGISVNTGNLSLSENSLIGSILLTGEGQLGVTAGDLVVNATGAITLDARSYIVNQGAEGSLSNTGNVEINAQSIRLTNQSLINSSSPRSRGNIILNAKDNVSLDNNSFISTIGIFNPLGKSGDITITTGNINLSNQSGINSSNIGQGQGGKITLKAQEAISLTSGSNVSSASTASDFGQVNNQPSGDIAIKTRNLTLDGDNTSISSANFDEGRGGNINIVADNAIFLNGFASISSSSNGQGDGGNIQLATRSLTLANGGDISTQSFGSGNSGNLLVNASDSVSISGIATFINPQTGETLTTGSGLKTSAFGTGNAGDITVKAQTINLSDQGIISSANAAQGNAGNIWVQAQDNISANNSFIVSNIGSSQRQPAKGNVGNIELSARTISLTNGAQLQAGFYSGAEGNAGLVSVKAEDSISFTGRNSGIFANVESGAIGNGSDIQIFAPSVYFTNGAVVVNSNAGQGNAGNIRVQAQENISLSSSLILSNIGSSQGQPAKGNVGNIELSARTVSLADGAQLQAGIYSGAEGNAGLVSIKAEESIYFTGTNSGIFTNVESGAVGNGSDIKIFAPSVSFTNRAIVNTSNAGQGNGGSTVINTENLFMRDGSQVFTGTFGTGKAGNLTVNASSQVELIGRSADGRFPSGLLASAEANSTGDAGDLTINTQNLLIRDGAQVFTGTFGAGNAGNLTVNASGQVELIGRSADGRFPSGLLASAEPNSTGNAGDMRINTPQLLVRNGAEVLVNARGTGNAGIMTINANTINLDNNASLNANTRSPNKDANREQATINLNTQNLTLRQGSSITTNATGENVFGGNINIYTKFLIALENSRISANSDNSRGGRVVVNAQGVFVGTQPSDVSKYITATSGVGLPGTVEINSPDNSSIQNSFAQIFPVIDTNKLIAQSCIARANKKQENSFFITGSGALNPNRPGGSISTYTTGEVRGVVIPPRPWKKGDPIIEATGVYHLDNGQILLSRECSSGASHKF